MTCWSAGCHRVGRRVWSAGPRRAARGRCSCSARRVWARRLLIDHACGLAASAGLAVGLGRGHPMETSLPFGLLAQALDGVGGRGLLGEDLPGPGTAGDRAARFYGVLRWLQDRTGSALLLAVDDLHWADADSLALVCFTCRRMGPLRLALIASLRPWPPQAARSRRRPGQRGHAAASAGWLR